MDAGAPGRRGFAVQTHGRRGADWPPTLVCLPVHAQTTWVTTAASLTVLCAVASGRLCLAKHPTMLLTTRKRGSTCSVSGRRGGRGCAGPEVLLRSSRHWKTGTARPPGRRGSVRCTWCRPRGWEAAAPRPRPRRGRREEAGGPREGSAHSTAPHHEELTQMRPSPPRAQQGGERSSRGPEPRGHVTPAACGRLRPPGAAPTSVLDALSSTDSHLSLQSGDWPCRTPTCSGPGGRQLRALKLRFKASTAGRGPAWSGKRLGVFRRLCAHPAGPGQAPAGRPGRAGVSCGVGRPRGASLSHLESPEGAERSRGAHLQPALCPPPP